MKNKTLAIIATFITIVISYFSYFSYTFINLKDIPGQYFKTKKKLDFHKKYSKSLHHIRDEVGLNFSDKETKATDLLFTNLNEIDNEKFTVLLQGDSWIDQISYPPYKSYESREIVKNFGNKKKIKFINAGISSFSPTLMNLQLNILENQFKIYPDVLIAYIDQTDIGDENCRYRENKIKKKDKLVAVKPEKYSNHLWDYSRIYGLSEIYLNYNSKLLRTFHIINFNFRYGINKQVQKFFKNNKKNKCYYREIENYLISPEKQSIKYFSNTLESYLKNIENKSHIKKVFLVTFPHKKHFLKKEERGFYKLNVSNLVDEIVKNRKKIKHINFSKELKLDNNSDYKEIWGKDTIHLNSESHANIFVKNILLHLENF